jgi:hypothetical protein
VGQREARLAPGERALRRDHGRRFDTPRVDRVEPSVPCRRRAMAARVASSKRPALARGGLTRSAQSERSPNQSRMLVVAMNNAIEPQAPEPTDPTGQEPAPPTLETIGSAAVKLGLDPARDRRWPRRPPRPPLGERPPRSRQSVRSHQRSPSHVERPPSNPLNVARRRRRLRHGDRQAPGAR